MQVTNLALRKTARALIPPRQAKYTPMTKDTSSTPCQKGLMGMLISAWAVNDGSPGEDNSQPDFQITGGIAVIDGAEGTGRRHRLSSVVRGATESGWPR